MKGESMTVDNQTRRAALRKAARSADRGKPLSEKMTKMLLSAGDLVKFSGSVLREIPHALRLYPGEVFRQAGILILSSAAVILFMQAMLGAVLGVTAHYLFNGVGIGSYIAAVNSVGSVRGILQIMFGWIVAAKIGCGIVAEIGAMRISDEIDAMEVMGIHSRAYLCSSRLAAAFVVMPFLFLTGLLVNFGAGYLVNTKYLNTVSEGGFINILFLFQNHRDFMIAMVWALIVGLVVILVACYYGYTASGGPVGVGYNTAQSMLVSMVLISVIAMFLVQLFYGNDANAPIAN